MKFGKYIDEQARPDWTAKYLDYARLKQYIKEAVAQLESGSDAAAFSPRTTSLSVARNHSESPEASFFTTLETEVWLLALKHALQHMYCQHTCCALRSRKFQTSLKSLSSNSGLRQRLCKSKSLLTKGTSRMMSSCM